MKSSKLWGLHSVQAALHHTPNKINKVWIDRQRQDKRLAQLLDELAGLGIEPEKADRKKLDRLSEGNNHQGVVAEVELPAELSESELKTAVESLAATPLFLVLDNVQDPHNLGACLRSADATGVHGVIITRDNAVGITPTVCKVASGAAETVPVYQVTNLSRTLRWLKERGIWVAGAAGDGSQSPYQTDLTVPLVLVIGAEGKGMRRLTREHCDLLLSLPMQGQVESLNLSVATGVLLYEILRQRSVSPA
ncbi:23S rRNA (guanosine(2251)-2'-O)-methyltransferase RlmB [Methylosarcina fibrata]|uniref:23S rRNA (guanosine(2251)-2'-O)-methyltransferase RlmB n=1 Tax=Methylosarcina fibrata TaxID=105972 RepID=UPI0003658804|nr:23S rRNA (guanosine(2251)-2'-O)-methyltransferase RlmB [Methylosarcina fibrata]